MEKPDDPVVVGTALLVFGILFEKSLTSREGFFMLLKVGNRPRLYLLRKIESPLPLPIRAPTLPVEPFKQLPP
jgi:hypothetical protein